MARLRYLSIAPLHLNRLKFEDKKNFQSTILNAF